MSDDYERIGRFVSNLQWGLATEIPRATEPCPLLVRVADDRCATCGWEAETHRAEALQSDSAEVTPDPPSSDELMPRGSEQ